MKIQVFSDLDIEAGAIKQITIAAPAPISLSLPATPAGAPCALSSTCIALSRCIPIVIVLSNHAQLRRDRGILRSMRKTQMRKQLLLFQAIPASG